MIIGEEPIGEKNVLALPACKLKKVLALLSTFGGKTQCPGVTSKILITITIDLPFIPTKYEWFMLEIYKK